MKKKALTLTLFYYIGRKRRNSEDEDMAECTTQATKPMRRLSKCIKISELKRHKNGIQKRTTRGALLGTNKFFFLRSRITN